MEVSGQVNITPRPNCRRGGGVAEPIAKENVCAPELVWSFWRREKNVLPVPWFEPWTIRSVVATSAPLFSYESLLVNVVGVRKMRSSSVFCTELT